MTPPSPGPLDDSTTASQSGPLETPSKQETPDTNEQLSPAADSAENAADSMQAADASAPGPLQKRRRVTRACDECRRKKIKCDGKQPCNHCVVYGYECTYDQPSNRRRNNATPQYVEALETQLGRARALLNAIFPQNQIDLADPSLDARLRNGPLPQPQPVDPPGSAGSVSSLSPTTRGDGQPPEQLESMVRATGNLELDDDGKWDYHGHSSGLSYIRKMREHLGDVMGPVAEGHGTPFIKSRPMSSVFDSPRSNQDSPTDGNAQSHSDIVELPPKDVVVKLVDSAITEGTSFLRVVHLPTFYKMVNKLYATPQENYTNEENTFLPLLYVVLAVGSLFRRNRHDPDSRGYEHAIDEGFKYFKASRQLLDIADCRDLTSLQAIIFMILFMQSSANIATCYSYIGVAIRAALRMGMHRSFNHNFNPIEAETRKRAFWVIRKMDIYVGALIGLPYTLNDEDIDQDFPTEVEDDYITETEIVPMPEGQISLMAASNAHTRLVIILAKIVRYIYPIKSTAAVAEQRLCSQPYFVSLDKLRELEGDLQKWLDELPDGLKPGGEVPFRIQRCQQLLRMAFAHAQMMLYRPFIHFVSRKFNRKTMNPAAYACAAACVSVSRNIVHITSEMKKNGQLIGAYWFSMYTTFFAVMSLVYFALENKEDPTTGEVMKDAMEGNALLAQLAKRNLAADRCSATLSAIFDRIPEDLKKPTGFALPKKRRQPASVAPRTAMAQPDTGADSFVQPRRANTFPDKLSVNTPKRASFPPAISTGQVQSPFPDSTFQQSPQTGASEIFDASSVPTPLSSSGASLNPNGSRQRSLASFTQPQQVDSFDAANTPMFSGNEEYNVNFTDISAMMFPSGDPFAYPNQPMLAFENASNPTMSSTMNSTIANMAANNNNNASQRYDFSGLDSQDNPSANLSLPANAHVFPQNSQDASADDIQLFGTMPMYLMPPNRAGNAGAGAFVNRNGTPMTNANANQKQAMPSASQPVRQQGFPESELNVSEMFAGGDEWAATFMDQGFGFGFGSGADGMNGVSFR